MDCFRYLEIGRLGVSESSLKFSPNLKNSEPPSSESNGGNSLDRWHPVHSHLKPRAKLQLPKIPLALGGGMGYTIFVLPLKGEITDYPRSGRVTRPA